MKNAVLVASLFLVIAAVSCKKDDDDKPVTGFDMITATSWKIDTIGWDMDKNGEIDGAITLQPCELDNMLTFSTDSTGVFDEGATKCDDSDDQSSAFTWMLSENDKLLTIDGNLPGQLGGEVDVVTLNNTNLVLSKTVTSSFPVPFDGNLIIALQK